jgi:hypothetical protein
MIVDDLFESGAFSYSAKKPRRGSVADLAAQKRKKQERGQQPAEPKDQRVGVAKVLTKGVAEGNLQEFAPGDGNSGRWYSDDDLADIVGEDWYEFDVSHEMGNIGTQGERARIFLAREAEAYLNDRGYNVNVLDVRDQGDNLSWYISGSLMNEQGVEEGSAQEKLYKRHQELRKKSGLPDAEYYQELKQTYTLPDEERYAKQAEIKKRYGVKEQRTQCPECGGAAYEDQMLAEKNDACYHKVKSRYKVWPSAYASGALVRCRKVGAKNWGNKSKK